MAVSPTYTLVAQIHWNEMKSRSVRSVYICDYSFETQPPRDVHSWYLWFKSHKGYRHYDTRPPRYCSPALHVSTRGAGLWGISRWILQNAAARSLYLGCGANTRRAWFSRRRWTRMAANTPAPALYIEYLLGPKFWANFAGTFD